MSFASAIYAGHVVHVRHRPKQHKMRYSVFSLLLDLDEMPSLGRSLRMFGHNRSAVFSVHDKDYGRGETGDLRLWADDKLREAGLDPTGMAIRMLCYPRIFGYAFNPLTVYFCYAPDGRIAAILYEVSNTFRERHTYVIPVAADEGPVRHHCAKEMYVSPFIPMDCTYNFRINPPDDTVAVNIGETDKDGALLFAGFSGKRRDLSDAGLLRMLLTYPLMTLKVMGGIHWEALRLWLKGTPIYRHKPAASPVATSIILHNGIKKS